MIIVTIFLLYGYFFFLFFNSDPEKKKKGKIGLIVLSGFLLTPVVVFILFFLTCFVGLSLR